MEHARDKEVQAILAAALAGCLTEQQAERLEAFGAELLRLALLAASKRIAELQAKLGGSASINPATPSGQRPIYTKPSAPKRKGRPGAKTGHPGARRPLPQRIDERKKHRLDRCPDCGGPLQRCNRTRTRTIEDILEDLRTVITEHTVERDYCPAAGHNATRVIGVFPLTNHGFRQRIGRAAVRACPAEGYGNPLEPAELLPGRPHLKGGHEDARENLCVGPRRVRRGGLPRARPRGNRAWHDSVECPPPAAGLPQVRPSETNTDRADTEMNRGRWRSPRLPLAARSLGLALLWVPLLFGTCGCKKAEQSDAGHTPQPDKDQDDDKPLVWSTIHEAVAEGDLADVKRHLYRGTAANARDLISGFTPLHLAAGDGNVEITRFLLASGADPNASPHYS